MSRRIILLDLPWTRDKDPRIPLGHACLLAALRTRTRAELRSLVIPCNSPDATWSLITDRILAEADRGGNDVDLAIGVYVWAEPLITPLLAELRRAGFRGRIILGGPQISYAPREIAHLYPDADVFVRGYAEAALCELVNDPGRPRVPGVVYRDGFDLGQQAEPELEAMPSPWLSGVVDVEPDSFIRWETQRGCPYRCSFCQHRDAGSVPARHRTDEGRIEAEIRLFARKRVREIAVLDPIFNARAPGAHDRATRILEQFLALGFRGHLSLQCRPELIDEDFLAVCAGLNVQLEFGLQTTEPNEWKPIRRGNQLARVDAALRGCRERGIDHQVSLIFGLPGQTLASFERSIEWCLVRQVPVIKAFPLMLLRGTELELQREHWGLRETDTAMPVVCGSNSFDERDWVEMARLSEALLATERTHPTDIVELRAIARDRPLALERWTPSAFREQVRP
jgi:radical SAM superfamily enzyme YgiQ (UPF0313 family)